MAKITTKPAGFSVTAWDFGRHRNNRRVIEAVVQQADGSEQLQEGDSVDINVLGGWLHLNGGGTFGIYGGEYEIIEIRERKPIASSTVVLQRKGGQPDPEWVDRIVSDYADRYFQKQLPPWAMLWDELRDKIGGESLRRTVIERIAARHAKQEADDQREQRRIRGEQIEREREEAAREAAEQEARQLEHLRRMKQLRKPTEPGRRQIDLSD